jgi:hypothetical protein
MDSMKSSRQKLDSSMAAISTDSKATVVYMASKNSFVLF